MSREYTAVPHEYLEEMDTLSDAEFGRLIRALLEYSMTGEERELSGGERVHWKRVRNRENRYQEGFENNEKVKTERAKNAANARWSNAKNANACASISSNAKNANTNTKTKAKTDTKANTEANPISESKSTQVREMEFEQFWRCYPRKEGKQKAREAFRKVDVDVGVLMDAVEQQKKSEQWRKNSGQFIPHASTWLNGRRWEDQMAPAAGMTTGRKLDDDEVEAIRKMMSSGKEEF